jgi:hypothetical protein
VAAFAYLIGGFTGFGRLGSFNRQALAWRVFGKDLVEDAAARVTATLQGWGYHPSDRAALGFRTVLIQSMLVNRSPLLEDMTSEALARIRADPSTAPHHSAWLLPRHAQGDLRARARRPASRAAARGDAGDRGGSPGMG